MWSRLRYSLIHFGELPSGGLQLSPPSSSNGGGYAEISRGCWRLLDVVFSGLGSGGATERWSIGQSIEQDRASEKTHLQTPTQLFGEHHLENN